MFGFRSKGKQEIPSMTRSVQCGGLLVARLAGCPSPKTQIIADGSQVKLHMSACPCVCLSMSLCTYFCMVVCLYGAGARVEFLAAYAVIQGQDHLGWTIPWGPAPNEV